MSTQTVQLTDQQIFDTVLFGLRRQGKPSLAAPSYTNDLEENEMPAAACAYRGVGGTKCAAGLLIDDKDYKPLFEGRSASKVYERWAYGGKVSQDQARAFSGLVTRLQSIHDKVLTQSVEKWEIAMQALASEFSLTYTQPEQ